MIHAQGLSKRYEDGTLALDALDLAIKRGEIYCLLGANGAGKTTVVNLFLNFIEPTEGRALVNGIDVVRAPLESKKYIAYVPENVRLYGNLSTLRNLVFFATLGGKSSLKRTDFEFVAEMVKLQVKLLGVPVRQLSKGSRQKLGIAIALIRDTPALILDEPTAGLDPVATAEFIETLRRLRDAGRAILMSTHDVFRAKEVCDRIGILKDGVKLAEWERAELENENLESLYLNYMRKGKEW